MSRNKAWFLKYSHRFGAKLISINTSAIKKRQHQNCTRRYVLSARNDTLRSVSRVISVIISIERMMTPKCIVRITFCRDSLNWNCWCISKQIIDVTYYIICNKPWHFFVFSADTWIKNYYDNNPAATITAGIVRQQRVLFRAYGIARTDMSPLSMWQQWLSDQKSEMRPIRHQVRIQGEESAEEVSGKVPDAPEREIWMLTPYRWIGTKW